MATIDLGQKQFWPQRALNQQSQVPDFSNTWMGDGDIVTPTYTTMRLRGRIVWADGSANTISKVYFRVGSVTTNLSANGGQIAVSVRAIGSTMIDDTGTLYGSATISSDLSANAVNSVTLGSTASLPDKTAVSVKFLGQTAYQRWEMSHIATDSVNHQPAVYTGESIGSGGQNQVPCLLFEAVDGTWGILEDTAFFQTSTTLSSFKSNGVAADGINEHGVRFTVANECRVIGVFMAGSVNSGVTGYKVAIAAVNGSSVPSAPVYEQTHVRMDWGACGTTQARPGFLYFASPVTLVTGTTYVLTVRNISNSTGATETMTMQSVVLASANHAIPQQLGTTYSAVKRAGGTGAFDTVTAYTVETDRWNNMGIIVDQITVADGAGSGGGATTYGGGYAA